MTRPELALAGAPGGDLLEEADGEEMTQMIDARIIGRVTIPLMELAELAMVVAAELVVPAFVAGVVDVRRHVGGALGGEQGIVVDGARPGSMHLFPHGDLQRLVARGV